MKDLYIEQLDSLIESSISIYKQNGQTAFNRMIQVPDTDRVTPDLIERVKKTGERMNIEIEFSEATRSFHMVIDVHRARLTLTQAKALIA